MGLAQCLRIYSTVFSLPVLGHYKRIVRFWNRNETSVYTLPTKSSNDTNRMAVSSKVTGGSGPVFKPGSIVRCRGSTREPLDAMCFTLSKSLFFCHGRGILIWTFLDYGRHLLFYYIIVSSFAQHVNGNDSEEIWPLQRSYSAHYHHTR